MGVQKNTKQKRIGFFSVLYRRVMMLFCGFLSGACDCGQKATELPETMPAVVTTIMGLLGLACVLPVACAEKIITYVVCKFSPDFCIDWIGYIENTVLDPAVDKAEEIFTREYLWQEWDFSYKEEYCYYKHAYFGYKWLSEDKKEEPGKYIATLDELEILRDEARSNILISKLARIK